MTTRLVGYQPQYFPRLHYYARFLNADIFKLSDNLQYVRRHAYPTADGSTLNGPSFQAHTPIKTSHGMHLLDIPVQHEGTKNDRRMDTVALDYNSSWQEKHLKTIEMCYAKAPRFNAVFPSLKKVLSVHYDSLASCTIATTVWGLALLFEIPLSVLETATLAEINAVLPFAGFRLKKIIRMSEAGLQPANKQEGEDVNEWLIAQCKALGADEYYFGGTAASAYIDSDRLRAAGIQPLQQLWQGASYVQQFSKRGFIPNLSIIDLLMNVSPEEARAILSTPNQ